MTHNRDALESALEALAIGPEHAPLVEAARSLASVVDDSFFNANAWREYRLTLENLMKATSHNGSDAFANWLDDMRAEVGDSSDTE